MPNLALLALEASDGTVVLTSITLVFAMLVALCLIITLEGKIFDGMAAKKKAAKEPAAPKAAAKPAAPKEDAAESSVDFTHEEEIDFDTFCKVELRVAEVRACERMKESKKLLHLTVFDGERERCILSGIAKWFKPEDLILSLIHI